MAKKKKNETPEEETVETVEETTAEVETVNPWEEKYNTEHDAHLRLAAEYDNFRKRSAKERDGIYADAVTDSVTQLLPLFDWEKIPRDAIALPQGF